MTWFTDTKKYSQRMFFFFLDFSFKKIFITKVQVSKRDKMSMSFCDCFSSRPTPPPADRAVTAICSMDYAILDSRNCTVYI